MSDASQGPGWWQASDGKWYPPETHPDFTAAPPTGAAPAGPPAPGVAPGPGGPSWPPVPGGAGGAPPEGTSSGNRQGPRKWLIALAVVVVLVLVGVGSLFVTGDDSDDGDTAIVVSDEGDNTEPDEASDRSVPDRSELSDPEPPRTEDSQESDESGSADLQVVESGMSQFTDALDGKVSGSWAAILENKGKATAELITVDASYLDANGQVLGADSTFVSVLPPGQQTAVTGDLFDVPAGVAELELRVSGSDFDSGEVPAPGKVTPDGVNITPSSIGGIKVTGTLVSTFAIDLKSVSAVAVYFDKAGNIVGGSETFVNLVPAGKSSGFQIDDFDTVPGIDHVQVLAQLPSDILR